MIDVAEPERAPSARGRGGVLRRARADARGPARGGRASSALASERWIAELRAAESERREAERAELRDERAPLHPMRLYAELGEVLDRDAIVIGDGGDFVSYAGRVIDSYQPGCWLDPGRSAASARARATRSRRSSRTPSARSCCCSATARSASRGWSSTRSRATA